MAPTPNFDHIADWVLMTDRVYLKTLSACIPWMVILRSLWLNDQIVPQLILCNWPIEMFLPGMLFYSTNMEVTSNLVFPSNGSDAANLAIGLRIGNQVIVSV